MTWELAYGGIFLCALALAAALTPLARWLSHRLGMLDEPTGDRKIHSTPMPLLGGVAVFLAFVGTIGIAAILAWVGVGEWSGKITHGFGRRWLEVGGLIGGGFLMLLLGMIDDHRDLHAGVKLIGQVIIATLVVVAGLRLKLFLPNPLLAGAVTVLWIVTITNAMNFFDNMDGACTGVGLIASVIFGVVAGLREQYLVCGLALAFAGALLGFLFYNAHPAKIFLGDAGSHLVGYILAMLAILPTYHKGGEDTSLAVLIPLFVLALPLFDLCSVVWIRFREGRPVYRGDKRHLAHRLAALGIPARAVAAILYGLQTALGLTAILLLWLPSVAARIAIAQAALVLVVIALLLSYAASHDKNSCLK